MGVTTLKVLHASTVALIGLVTGSHGLAQNGQILARNKQAEATISPSAAFTTSAGGLSAICHDFECSIYEGTSEVMVLTVPPATSTSNASTNSVSRTSDPHTSSATVDYWTTAFYTFLNSTLAIPIPTGYTLPHPTYTSSNNSGVTSWAPWTTAANSTGPGVISPITITGTQSFVNTTSVGATQTTSAPFTNATSASSISTIHSSSTAHSTSLNTTLGIGPSRTVTYTFTATYPDGSSSVTTTFTETWTFPGGVSVATPTASSPIISTTARNSSSPIVSATSTSLPTTIHPVSVTTIYIYPPTMQGTTSLGSSLVNVTDTSTATRTQSQSVEATSFANTESPAQPTWAGWTDWATTTSDAAYTTLITMTSSSNEPAQDERTSRFAAVLTKRYVERGSDATKNMRGRGRFF